MEELIKQLESDEVLELNAQDSNNLNDYILEYTEYDLEDFRMSRQEGIIEVWLA